MRKRYWILGGVLVLDLLVVLFARPLLLLLEGNHGERGWGVPAVRRGGGVVAVGLGIALVVVWNLDCNLPKK